MAKMPVTAQTVTIGLDRIAEVGTECNLYFIAFYPKEIIHLTSWKEIETFKFWTQSSTQIVVCFGVADSA